MTVRYCEAEESAPLLTGATAPIPAIQRDSGACSAIPERAPFAPVLQSPDARALRAEDPYLLSNSEGQPKPFDLVWSLSSFDTL
jgi:hypothetical protein